MSKLLSVIVFVQAISIIILAVNVNNIKNDVDTLKAERNK